MSYLTEFDQERHDRALLSQGIEQGIEQVREAFLERAVKAVRDGVLSLPEAASVFGFAEDKIRVRL